MAGVATAAFTAWQLRPRLAPNSLSIRALLIVSAAYVLSIFLAAAAAVFITRRFKNSRQENLRIAAAIVWMAPLFLFVFYGSSWSALTGAILGFCLATLWRSTIENQRFIRSLQVSTILQLALIATLAGHSRVAALLMAAGTAILVRLLPGRRASRFTMPRMLAQIALAIVLVTMSLSPFLIRAHIDGSNSWLESLLAGGTAEAASTSEAFPAHWDPKLRIPRGQVVAAASIVSPKY